MKTHANVKQCSRSLCTKSFGSSGALQKHVKMHTGEKPFVCDHCMRTHTSERPYVCDQCPKLLNSSRALHNYMRVHTEDKRPRWSSDKTYMRTVCQSFSNAQNLTLHLRVHSGENTFQCAECSDSFSQSSILRVH